MLYIKGGYPMDPEEEKKTEEKCPVSDEEMKDVSGGGSQQGSPQQTRYAGIRIP